jgi:alanyl-tRNA synthetase
VGTFSIVGDSSIAAGTRRIEALVGQAASEQQGQQVRLLHEAARRLGRPIDAVVTGLDEILEQLKRLEREKRELQGQLARFEAERLKASAKEIRGVRFITATIKNADKEVLAAYADALRSSVTGDGFFCLASGDQGQRPVAVVMATTAGMAKRLHAGELLKAVAPLIDGSGGGRPDFAQGGGRNAAGLQDLFEATEQKVREILEQGTA